MAELTIFEELTDLLGLEMKDGEPAPDFAERLALKANNIKDNDWETLTEKAQVWVNSALTALEEKTDLPALEGLYLETEEVSKSDVEGQELENDPPTQKPKAKKKAVTALTTAFKAKKPKIEKKAVSTGGGRPGPKSMFADNAKIKVLVDKNPKRAGSESALRFAKYKTGQTVAEAFEAGLSSADLRYDTLHKFITIS
jgi:hypothetical protein